MKKALSLIIVLILLISALPMNVFAADEAYLADSGVNIINGDVGDLKWKLDTVSGVLLIYGSGGLPDYIFNKPPWYKYRHDIKTISLSEGVLDITPWLFCSERDNLKNSYDKLETLILSKTVTSIGGSSFTNCINLKQIKNIPSSLTYIGTVAFYNCDLHGTLDLSPLETIESSAFEDNINLTEVVFSDNLREVDTCAFLDCGLTSVSFGPSIEELGDYSFGFKEVKSYYTGETVKEKIPGFTIYGYEDTEAEVYANKYGFTFVSLNEIHSVNVTITEPEGGNKPSYSVTLPSGSNYKQRDLVGADMINGVTWYNYDGYEHVGTTDKFEAGKKYIVSVILCPKSDIYRFADDVEYTVNGSSSGVPASIESDEIELICTFTAGPEKIYNVDVSGIVPPVGGKQPSYKATIPADKGYKLDTYSDDEQENGVVWVSYDSQKTMEKTDTFMILC